ncbi:hypothetical protein BC941DRAFT_477352 [Chlamydoabsidia padenii]|nr:hypothetical protein BC941DRAFT_477352 [Chlamydoabsidia padenii]
MENYHKCFYCGYHYHKRNGTAHKAQCHRLKLEKRNAQRAQSQTEATTAILADDDMIDIDYNNSDADDEHYTDKDSDGYDDTFATNLFPGDRSSEDTDNDFAQDETDTDTDDADDDEESDENSDNEVIYVTTEGDDTDNIWPKEVS